MRLFGLGEPTFNRIVSIVVLVAFVFGLFTFKLFRLQVVQHSQFAEASESQSTSTSVQQAQRGQILAKDRDGKIYSLAVSNEEYQLQVAPQQVRNKQVLAEELAKLIPSLSAEKIFEQIDVEKVYVPPIIKGLTRLQADEIIDKDFRGVYVEPELVRVYPEGSAIAAQVIGYVGADGQGKYGIEAEFDAILKGIAGSETAKKDSFGRLIEILGGSSSEPGKDVLLTVDYNLQYFVERRLIEALKEFKADSGSVVVMEAKTGAILALAGQPTYDPNKFSLVKTKDQGVFLVPAASAGYEAGSVVKPITMSMALDLEKVKPETEEVFSGSVKVGDFTIKNAEDKVYGRENMTQVLENSDNVAMVWLGKKIGIDKQYEYLQKFGYGKKTEVGLVGEASGILHERKDWNSTLSATAAFGQGFTQSLIQLVKAYAVFGNGGKTVQPHLVSSTILNGQVEKIDYPTGEAIIKPETAKTILRMLESVVINGHGKRAQVKGVKVGGKTGTAQVPSPTGGYKENEHIGTFVGVFPINNPQFVMAVRLDNPKTVRFAESSAAPVFGTIADWMATYFRLR